MRAFTTGACSLLFCFSLTLLLLEHSISIKSATKSTMESVSRTIVHQQTATMESQASYLAENPAFLELVEKQQSSAIDQRFRILIREGSATGVALLDSTCKIQQKTGLGNPTAACKRLIGEDPPPKKNSASLTILHPFSLKLAEADSPYTSRKSFFLAIEQEFTPEFFASRLAQKGDFSSDLLARIQLTNEIPLISTKIIDLGSSQALIIDGFTLLPAILYESFFDQSNQSRKLLIAILVLTLLLIISQLLASLRSQQSLIRDSARIRKYFQGPQGGESNPTSRRTPDFENPENKKALLLFLDNQFQAQQRLKDKIIQIEGKNRRLRTELLKAHESLAIQFEEQELSDQIKLTSSELSRRLRNTLEFSEDLSDILNLGLNQSVNGLNDLGAYWKQGVESRGARKFIRSLSETAYTGGTGTELDRQILNIECYTAKAQEFVIAALQRQQKIEKNLAWFTKVSEYWHSLSVHKEDIRQGGELAPHDLFELSELACDLIPSAHVTIEANLGTQILPQNISRKGYITSLSGVIRILVKLGGEEKPKIKISSRDASDKFRVLVLTEDSTIEEKKAQEHQKKIALVGSSYGIQIEKLHTNGTTSLFCLSWNKAEQRSVACLSEAKQEDLSSAYLRQVGKEKNLGF